MSTEAGIQNSEDQRKRLRISIPDHPRIFDVHTDTVVGQLVNLSEEGLMMMSPTPVKPGTLIQMRIPLQCGAKVIDVLIGVESLWCDDTDTSGICWTGFHIIDISAEHRKIISSLVYN